MNASAASSTYPVRGPALVTSTRLLDASYGTRANPGASPTVPDHAAGMRIDPPPSHPMATGTMPAATATAEPEDDPPLNRSNAKGFLGPWYQGLYPVGWTPCSCMTVVPTMIAPAALRRLAMMPSSFATSPLSLRAWRPPVKRRPLTASSGLIITGTPSQTPRCVPLVQRADDSAAACDAPSRSSSWTQRSVLSVALMNSTSFFTTCHGFIAPLLYALWKSRTVLYLPPFLVPANFSAPPSLAVSPAAFTCQLYSSVGNRINGSDIPNSRPE
mmetsp:Transcript_49907/g.117576  ORF Transcript_49907/g.117576 Transcript_49907/m.117576 type:complete len:272 (-) Transcript_49907:501-1316(-)